MPFDAFGVFTHMDIPVQVSMFEVLWRFAEPLLRSSTHLALLSSVE
jgi:hypothetical protein